MASEYTNNYNLDLYVAQDKPNLRDQYNSAMRKIDTQMATNAGNIATMQGSVSDAVAQAQAASAAAADASTAAANASTAAADASAAVTEERTQRIAADADLQTQINALSPTGGNMVVFGDSFTDPEAANSESARWVVKVSGILGTTVYNFAKAGAGFARTSNPLSSQVGQVTSQMSETERNNTSFVFCMMGYNDIVNGVSATDIGNAVAAFVTSCNTLFPNAKLIMIPFNWGYGDLRLSYQHTIFYAMRNIEYELSALTIPHTLIKNMRYWLIGTANCFRNSVHPNVRGYDVISSHIISAMNGNDTDTYRNMAAFGSVGSGNIVTNEAVVQNGMITIEFSWYGNSVLNNYTKVFDRGLLYGMLKPEHDILFHLQGNASPETDNGIIRINTAGEVTIRCNTSASERTLYGSVTYPLVVNDTWS